MSNADKTLQYLPNEDQTRVCVPLMLHYLSYLKIYIVLLIYIKNLSLWKLIF